MSRPVTLTIRLAVRDDVAAVTVLDRMLRAAGRVGARAIEPPLVEDDGIPIILVAQRDDHGATIEGSP
jgi:hypothetical protein